MLSLKCLEEVKDALPDGLSFAQFGEKVCYELWRGDKPTSLINLGTV
jgi:hypothetical protein